MKILYDIDIQGSMMHILKKDRSAPTLRLVQKAGPSKGLAQIDLK
ncbi:hypothetical protein CHCC20375_2743 [Bacillus licheniformis]|nr:hypothetical protein CHCC20375_2743 [Bacillus licheniformis]